MGPGRAAFLAVAILTHAVIGYALVYLLTDLDPRIGLVLGVLPDVDFLFPAFLGPPFVHRGITHTPVFLASLVAVIAVVGGRRGYAVAAAAGVGSHLILDSLSPKGIPWAYPVIARNVGFDLPVHGPVATALLWAVVGALVLGEGGSHDDALERFGIDYFR